MSAITPRGGCKTACVPVMHLHGGELARVERTARECRDLTFAAGLDRTLAGSAQCQLCSMGFRIASAVDLVEAGELEDVARRLGEAKRIAAMWNGGPWVAAVWEARGVLQAAQGNRVRAMAECDEAATRARARALRAPRAALSAGSFAGCVAR